MIKIKMPDNEQLIRELESEVALHTENISDMADEIIRLKEENKLLQEHLKKCQDIALALGLECNSRQVKIDKLEAAYNQTLTESRSRFS